MGIDEQSGQRMMIEFLMKLGKKSQEINEMLSTVYGDNALKKTSFFKWINRFNEIHENCNDDVRPRHSLTSAEDNIIDCGSKKLKKISEYDLKCCSIGNESRDGRTDERSDVRITRRDDLLAKKTAVLDGVFVF